MSRVKCRRSGSLILAKCAPQIFLAAIIALSAAPIAARDKSDGSFDGVRRFIIAKVADGEVPSVSVAVSRNGRIIWEESFGFADRERRIAATPDTQYRIASISKSFTATGLMLLVQSGQIDLDAAANRYLGGAIINARVGRSQDVTIRRLASHTSGLAPYVQNFYQNEPWPVPPEETTIARYGEAMTEPGSKYEYSNLNYGVLGYIISRVSGVPFGQFMRERVFLPLGLFHTTVHVDPRLPPAAIPYGDDGLPIAPFETDQDGSAAILTSAHDLVRFGLFHLKTHLQDQKPLLPDAVLDSMHAAIAKEGDGGGGGYGIGWETSEGSGGEAMFSHSGSMPGSTAELRIFPKEKIAVAVLINCDAIPIDLEIMRRILASVAPQWIPKEGEEAPPRAPGFSPSPAYVGEWTGRVRSYEGDTPATIIVKQDGDIHIKLGDQLETSLSRVALSSDGYLTGYTQGRLNISDAVRRPYALGISIKLRAPRVMNGTITALATNNGVWPTYGLYPSVNGYPSPRFVQKQAFALPQWIEVTKK